MPQQDDFDDLRGFDEEYKRTEVGGGWQDTVGEGTYEVRVDNAVLKRHPTDHRPIFELHTTVTGGSDQHIGGRIQISFFIQESTHWNLKKAMNAIGLDLLPGQLKANLSRFRGLRLRVSVTMKAGRLNKEILERLQGTPQQAAPPPTAIDESEIPF